VFPSWSVRLPASPTARAPVRFYHTALRRCPFLPQQRRRTPTRAHTRCRAHLPARCTHHTRVCVWVRLVADIETGGTTAPHAHAQALPAPRPTPPPHTFTAHTHTHVSVRFEHLFATFEYLAVHGQKRKRCLSLSLISPLYGRRPTLACNIPFTRFWWSQTRKHTHTFCGIYHYHTPPWLLAHLHPGGMCLTSCTRILFYIFK